MNQKTEKILIITGIIFLILVVAGANGYYFLIQKKQTTDQNKRIENLTSENEIDTTNWNIYIDQENGFQIKYPLEIKESDIEIKDKGFETHYQKFNPKEIIFNYVNKDAVFTISIVDRWSNVDLFQNAYSCGDPSGYQKNIEINGIQGIEVTGLSKCPIDTIQEVDFVYFEKDSKVYILEVAKNNHWGGLNLEEELSKELIKIFHQMLSTFKFTENTTGNTQQINQTAGASDLECHNSQKYFFISNNADILIKYKKSADENIPCDYTVQDNDFKIDGVATFFLAFEGDFLILDRGTAPFPRDILVYDLNKKKEVYFDYYSAPILIKDNTISYWNPTIEKVTEENCPKSTQYYVQGLGAEIESHVVLDLKTLDKKDLGEYRCFPTQ